MAFLKSEYNPEGWALCVNDSRLPSADNKDVPFQLPSLESGASRTCFTECCLVGTFWSSSCEVNLYTFVSVTVPDVW